MLTIQQLVQLKKLANVLDSQYQDHCARNYGDRDGWTRHLMSEMEKFSETLDESPWDLFDRLLKEAKAQEAIAAEELALQNAKAERNAQVVAAIDHSKIIKRISGSPLTTDSASGGINITRQRSSVVEHIQHEVARGGMKFTQGDVSDAQPTDE